MAMAGGVLTNPAAGPAQGAGAVPVDAARLVN